MMYSRNLIYFFNIILSLFFFNIHFINGSENELINSLNNNSYNNNNAFDNGQFYTIESNLSNKKQNHETEDNNNQGNTQNDNQILNKENTNNNNNNDNNNNNSENKQNNNSIEQHQTIKQEGKRNNENENNNTNNVNYIIEKNIFKKKEIIEIKQENYQNHTYKNKFNNKTLQVNEKKEIEKPKTDKNRSKNKNNITPHEKINFTITILRNDEILDDIKIDNIKANDKGCFILDFKNCIEEQLKRFIDPIKSIINKKKKGKEINEKMEVEEEKKENEEDEKEETKNKNNGKQTNGQDEGENENEKNKVELKVEEVGVPQQKEQNEEEEEIEQEENNDKGKRNQNNIENNDKGEVDEGKTDKKETKNKNKKEINDKDEMETNIQKKDIKYEVLLIRNVSSDKNGKWKKGKNNNNSESLVNYISSNGNMKDDKDNCYKFEIHNGDRLIIEIYDDKFKEKIDEYYGRLLENFSVILPIIQKVAGYVKENYEDIYDHYNRIENIKVLMSKARTDLEHEYNTFVFLYHKYKISKEICDLFDKLNKEKYSECRKIIEAENNKQNQNYINQNYQVDFNIDEDIKNSIDSISILKLHKEIYDEENNTGEIEQYKSKNGPCDSCKRRVYMDR